MTAGVSNLQEEEELEICRGGSGMVFPLFDFEADLHWFIQALLYGLGLCWCFCGVSLIAEVFMCAIERVTSKKILKRVGGKMVTVKVWNDTVANLTLMALGSSAPEILLSLIELVGNDFYSGALGPSTIVGSAAFNLLVITAVCVCCIPPTDTGEPGIRIIKDTNVFAVTGTFSILAYIWVLVILMGPSPDVVSIWEGVLTFSFFGVLIILAYLVDIGVLARTSGRGDKVIWSEVSHEELANMEHRIRERHGADLTHDQVTALLHYEFSPCASRAHYRVAATRNLLSGKTVDPNQSREQGRKLNQELQRGTRQTSEDITRLYFPCLEHTVLESVGTISLFVERDGGDLSKAVTVQYNTRDGSAQAGSDYDAKGGLLEFEPYETQKVIAIRIIDDNEHEETEQFFVDLHDPEFLVGDGLAELKTGAATATIVIVDDDMSGELSFKSDQEIIEMPATPEPFTRDIKVQRKNGGCGKISCSYETEDDDATHGYDYESTSGRLEFAPGAMEMAIKVRILPRGRYEGGEKFRIILKDPIGTTFDESTDGGKDTCICTVFIHSSSEHKDRIETLRSHLRVNQDKIAIGNACYREQFMEAIYCGGSPTAQSEASWLEYGNHIVVFPWKIFCAFVPPADYCGGWLCFIFALVAIAVVTALIGDLAELFGCAIHLRPMTTAISIVALGTSLPDTFASKTAAMQDPYADASVGNVTGSNSVNVFLGLGLPWLLGAIYWWRNGATDQWVSKYGSREDTRHVVAEWRRTGECSFVVPKAGLDVSVMVFSLCAITCIFFLVFRRFKFGGELGGPSHSALASGCFLISLWLIYIIVSIVIDYSNPED